jgi:hypothetical protein
MRRIPIVYNLDSSQRAASRWVGSFAWPSGAERRK